MRCEASTTVRYDEVLTDDLLEAARLTWEAKDWYIVRVETSTEYIRLTKGGTIKGPTSTVIYLESNIAQ